MAAVAKIDARERSVERAVESWDVNLGEVHIGEMLTADSSDRHPVHDRQAKFYG